MDAFDRVIVWAPRVLSVCFALFLGVFALDAFTVPFDPTQLIGFLAHLLPTLVLLLVVFIAWRRELVGAAAFLVVAAFYILNVGLDRPWSWYAAIAGPAALVGILYLAAWYVRRRGSAA